MWALENFIKLLKVISTGYYICAYIGCRLLLLSTYLFLSSGCYGLSLVSKDMLVHYSQPYILSKNMLKNKADYI